MSSLLFTLVSDVCFDVLAPTYPLIDVCPQQAVRPLVNPTVVKFLSSRYPQASQYELPAGRVNNCRWVGLVGRRVQRLLNNRYFT